MSVAGQTIEAFSVELSSSRPTPGGGGASAVIAALGASLGAMVVRYAAGKPKWAAHASAHASALAELDSARGALLELADRDASAYAAFAAAMGLAKDDPGRAAAMDGAVRQAMAVPLELMERCVALVELLGSLRETTASSLASDLGIAAIAADAACRGGRLLVLANAAWCVDAGAAEAARSSAGALLERSAAALRGFGVIG